MTAIDNARRALARGDVLIAYDHACAALTEDPADVEALHLAALSLARAGAGKRAEAVAETLCETIAKRTDIAPALREDAAALIARLAKDRALQAPAPERTPLLAEAASRYAAVAATYDSHYAAVNAATLWLLAGDTNEAEAAAHQARALAGKSTRASDAYWSTATLAEAALVLGDVGAAAEALGNAAEIGRDNVAALAATRRQLRRVCDAKRIDARILDAIAPLAVVHFCGARHIPADREQEVQTAVRQYVTSRAVGFGYGSLASGADILVAEALLDAGAEVHVVLPFAADEFEQVSVAPSGTEWVERFRSGLKRATSVTHASDSGYHGDDELFRHAARMAMGHAILRSTYLDAEVEQLAIWDGTDHGAPAGTAHDVAQWRSLRLSSHVISLPGGPEVVPTEAAPPSIRSVRGILFADFQGFSRLHDEHFPHFVDAVMGALARVLDQHGDGVLWRNTWGDAVQAIFRDVVDTAACALGFQEAVSAIDFAGADLPIDLHLRIGAHVGPVMRVTDPLLDRETFVGRELTRAARIEPLTPTGEVYVTDAFAAVLTVDSRGAFATEYVGRITTAKDFETIPMYRLHRRDV